MQIVRRRRRLLAGNLSIVMVRILYQLQKRNVIFEFICLINLVRTIKREMNATHKDKIEKL